jgi:mono/diheme cytochrome c family protein
MSRRALVLAIAVAGACLGTVQVVAAAEADPQDFTQVERGRYLAAAADCQGCHTLPGNSQFFAGGRPIETPFGMITSPNITPDRTTGIGAWSDQQFDDAMRRGIRPDASRLYPAMPYTAYTKMSHDDVLAIRAYLNTVTPVDHRVVSNTLPFPFNIRFAMRVWDGLFFTEGEFKADPKKSPEWNRGAFLVDGPSHCGACHTPKNFLGADKASEYLRGSYLQGWFAPDITNDSRRGLGGWAVDDIAAYLKTGHNRITAATGPMGEEVTISSSRMTDQDIHAIATYLKTIDGRNDAPPPLRPDDPAMVAGQAIYHDACSACHMLDGKGVEKLFPSLADSSMARSDDPTTLIRMVLRGARSTVTKDEPTSPGMPSFAWQLNDAQVAAVLTYIRNSWGKSAPPVGPDAVVRAKHDLASRVD